MNQDSEGEKMVLQRNNYAVYSMSPYHLFTIPWQLFYIFVNYGELMPGKNSSYLQLCKSARSEES